MNELSQKLSEIFPDIDQDNLSKWEELIRTDEFEPFPISIMVSGFEIRLLYEPSDFFADDMCVATITSMAEDSDKIAEEIADFYRNPKLKVKVLKYDGRSKFR